jgi:GYF domain 2
MEASAVSDGWHYAQGQKSFGPLDLSKMQEVFSKASNPRNILVWKVGFKEWKRAEDVPELAGLIYKPPPLPPDQIISPETTAEPINEAAANWIKGLPRRWAMGGLVLGLVWSLTSSTLQGSFVNPAGGHLAGLVRLLLLIVIPFCVLGFVWGTTERFHLERMAQSSARFQKAINRYTWRQTGKAIFCGVLFALFTYGHGFIRSLKPWDSEANITANISSISAYAWLAIPVGVLVGIFTRRNLKRRLSNENPS